MNTHAMPDLAPAALPPPGPAPGAAGRDGAAWLPRLYWPLLALLCAVYAWRPLRAGDDFWAHAAVGRWIWEQHQVPQHTLFLWTASQPWVAHSWLSQLTFYGLMAAGGETVGPYLALLLAAVLIAASFALLWRLWARHARLTVLTPFLFSLGIQCARERFEVRPELFSGLFLACLLSFLTSRSDAVPGNAASTETEPRASNQLWRRLLPEAGLVVLFTLWANTHGAVANGLMILGVTIICDLLQDGWNPRTRRLAALGLLCLAAACLTPYGPRYWQALRQVNSATFAATTEWKPFWVVPVLPLEFVLEVAVLWVLALAAWAMNPQRRWAHLLWLLVLGASFLHARRQMWLLALVCLAVLAANAAPLDTNRLWQALRRRAARSEPRAMPPRWRLLARTLAVVALAVSLLIAVPNDFFPLHAIGPKMPYGMVRFIERHEPGPHIFNDFSNSCYLHWHFGARLPLFIDTLNAYPDKLTLAYQAIEAATPQGRALLDGGGIDYVALRSPFEGGSWPRLAPYLNANPKWALVYLDTDGAIWVPRTPQHAALWQHPELHIQPD